MNAPDHVAMYATWQSARAALRNTPSALAQLELLRAENTIRMLAWTQAPADFDNALALLKLTTDFFMFCDGDMTDQQFAMMDDACRMAMTVLCWRVAA